MIEETMESIGGISLRKRDLTRLLIESTVDRALRDMERDAHRSVRNLVDLALTFSKGTFERHFLTLCRSILEDETSPYYQLLDRALRTCDRQTLKTFGINVGYEGCSKGARRIREVEAAQGFNVPWALTIQAGSQGLSRLYLQRLATEGTELGIHVFLLQDFQLEQDVLEQLLREHPTCAFVVFTSGPRGADWNLGNLARLPNLLLSVDAQKPLVLELCRALEEERMPYALHLGYSEEDAGTLPSQLEELLPLGSLLVLLYAQGASPQTQQAVYRQVQNARTAHSYPFGLMELTGDLLFIDQVISDDPCSLTFLADGRAVAPDGPTAANIRDKSLARVLREVLPKHSSKTEK